MYKKVYDKNKGIFIYVDAHTGKEIIHGTGIFDTLTKLFSSGVASSISTAGKKALETAGKAALESGTKKVGTEVGNLAADKIVEKLKKKPAPAVGNLIAKELQEKNNNKNNNEEDIHMRINRILSGSGTLARAGTSAQQKRINRLIYKN